MSMGSYLSDLHTHTDFSHGKGSPEDIVRAGIRCGLKRIAITEHAGGHVFYGVRGEKLTRLRKETERLAEPSPYRSLARERASAGEERLLSRARRSKRS